MKFYIKTEEEVKSAQETRNNTDKAAIDVMQQNEQYQDDPCVGIFWYDVKNAELFGVQSTLAEDLPWYESNQFGSFVRTERRLHKSKWQKEYFRDKDSRFRGEYTKVPRGRVFEFKDSGFKVYTGDWIDSYPNVKKLILEEFQLPEDTEFVKDVHWDVGHGWSDEF